MAPVPIEDAIKEQLPCVSNCMLVGDQRKFLSVLLTLKVGLLFVFTDFWLCIRLSGDEVMQVFIW